MPIRHAIIESVSFSKGVDPDEILTARSRSMIALGSDQVEIYKTCGVLGCNQLMPTASELWIPCKDAFQRKNQSPQPPLVCTIYYKVISSFPFSQAEGGWVPAGVVAVDEVFICLNWQKNKKNTRSMK